MACVHMRMCSVHTYENVCMYILHISVFAFCSCMLNIIYEYYSMTYFSPYQIFHANTDPAEVVLNRVPQPVLARFVRIRPQTWRNGIALRFELYGCQITGAWEILKRLLQSHRCYRNFLFSCSCLPCNPTCLCVSLNFSLPCSLARLQLLSEKLRAMLRDLFFSLWWFSDSGGRWCGPKNWMWFKHAEPSNTKHQNNSLNLTFTPIAVCTRALSHTPLCYLLYVGSP